MTPGIDPRMLGGCELERLLERVGDASTAELLRFSAGQRMRIQQHAEHCKACSLELVRLLDETRFGEDPFRDLTLAELELRDELDEPLPD